MVEAVKAKKAACQKRDDLNRAAALMAKKAAENR